MTKTKEESQALATQQNGLTMSEKFTNRILQEFGGSVAGEVAITDYQRSLIQGYFIAIDRTLKAAEKERLRKNENNSDHKYDNNLPINWNTVNLNDLALDVVHYARLGLDMTADNHLFPIPFKNNKQKCYDINLMKGYNGIRYIAEKYAISVPKAVNVEVVYSTDIFKAIKKSKDVQVETYEFDIVNAFDRGDIVGAFAYIEHEDPTKNELVIMSMKDIMKRKPQHASPNFWGGKCKSWQNGKPVEEEKEGWMDEMVRKTIIREAYSSKHIPIDPAKVDENYQYLKMREARYAEMEVDAEVAEKANLIEIDTAKPQSLPEVPEIPVEPVPSEAESGVLPALASEEYAAVSEPSF